MEKGRLLGLSEQFISSLVTMRTLHLAWENFENTNSLIAPSTVLQLTNTFHSSPELNDFKYIILKRAINKISAVTCNKWKTFRSADYCAVSKNYIKSAILIELKTNFFSNFFFFSFYMWSFLLLCVCVRDSSFESFSPSLVQPILARHVHLNSIRMCNSFGRAVSDNWEHPLVRGDERGARWSGGQHRLRK